LVTQYKLTEGGPARNGLGHHIAQNVSAFRQVYLIDNTEYARR
jgi:hypothetical protein